MLTITEQISRSVEAVFSGVTLGNGIGLRQANGLDDYASPSALAELRASDEKEDWRRISVAALNRNYCGLSYFDAEGMRFHLPAFLIADLNGSYRFDMTITLMDIDDHKARQFALLDQPQRSAVNAFLQYRADQDPVARAGILHALESYWT